MAMRTNPSVVVVLRGLGLGDLCTAVPSLRGLRETYPDHHLVLAGPGGSSELLSSCWVDEVIPTAGPSLSPDVQARFRGHVAVAVNLHGVGPHSTRSLHSLGACRTMAFQPPERNDCAAMGPTWWPDEHEVRRWCRLVAHWGVRTDPADLSLVAPPLPPWLPAGATIVHPGAASAARRWPRRRFAQVASALSAAGHQVVLTGGPDEIALCHHVAEVVATERPRPMVLAGATSWGDLSALIARARLLVCNDTGVAHLASAHRTPSVVLFGPTSPQEWGPPHSGPHAALWAGTRGDPHGDEIDPGLARIEVHEVLRAVTRVDTASRVAPTHERSLHGGSVPAG